MFFSRRAQMISTPFTSNNKLTRRGSRHPVIKQRIHYRSGGQARPRRRQAERRCRLLLRVLLYSVCYSCPSSALACLLKKNNVFAVLILKGNGAIKGIGLLFLSLYLVVVTAPPADLGRGMMMVARGCRCFGCRSMNPRSKPVRLFHQKPVKMILMASFLNSHPSKYKSNSPPAPQAFVLSVIFL